MGNLLVPFKKFLSNKNTITILGVLVGIVVLYLGYTWRVQKSIKPTQVPYCNTTLIQGTKITNDYIEYLNFPRDMIAGFTNIETDASAIIGKMVNYDGKIPQNSFFFDEQLTTEEEWPDSIFSNIQDGHTIYRLKVDSDKTYANSIMPENKIDLYMSTTADEEDGKLVFGRLISEIQVLAVKDGDGKNVFADSAEPLEPAYLLFSVPEDLFLLLMKAEKLGIEIMPVPRNESYSASSEATQLTSKELEAMIINRTHQISDECTDLTVCG